MSRFQRVLTITIFVLLYGTWILCVAFFIRFDIPLGKAIWPYNFMPAGTISIDDMSGLAMISSSFLISSVLILLNIVALVSPAIERLTQKGWPK